MWFFVCLFVYLKAANGKPRNIFRTTPILETPPLIFSSILHHSFSRQFSTTHSLVNSPPLIPSSILHRSFLSVPLIAPHSEFAHTTSVVGAIHFLIFRFIKDLFKGSHPRYSTIITHSRYNQRWYFSHIAPRDIPDRFFPQGINLSVWHLIIFQKGHWISRFSASVTQVLCMVM